MDSSGPGTGAIVARARPSRFETGALALGGVIRAMQALALGLLASLACLCGVASDAAGSSRGEVVQRTQLGLLGSPARFAARQGEGTQRTVARARVAVL